MRGFEGVSSKRAPDRDALPRQPVAAWRSARRTNFAAVDLRTSAAGLGVERQEARRRRREASRLLISIAAASAKVMASPLIPQPQPPGVISLPPAEPPDPPEPPAVAPPALPPADPPALPPPDP